MSHDSEKLLSLAAAFEAKAVEKIEPLHAVKQWYISYFPSQDEAELAAKGSGEAKHVGSGWLVTPDNQIFKDQDGFTYTEKEVELIEARKAPPQTIKRLRNEERQKRWKAADQFRSALQLISLAKDSKKLDPKAKVRNRGTVCVPAENAKDKKDHFPINDADQARNALARVHQYSSVPSWYNGSLKGLQALVSRKVHAKYPKIGKDKKDKKSSEIFDAIIKTAEPKYSLIEEIAGNYSDLDQRIKEVRSRLHKLIKEKEELNFKGGPASEKSRLNKAISMMGDEILGLELQHEKNKERARQLRELSEAQPYTESIHDPGLGLADDK